MELCWDDVGTRRRMLAVPAVYFLFYMVYFNLLEERIRPRFWISCGLDAYIPFCEVFILPYLAWFVLVPALFAICVAGLHPMVIACAALFCVGGILRLAYYNLMPEEEEGFVGVPTTIASMFAALFTWLFGLMFPRLWGLIGPALVLLGALMVCRKRFYGTNFLRVLFGVIGLGFVIAGLCL